MLRPGMGLVCRVSDQRLDTSKEVAQFFRKIDHASKASHGPGEQRPVEIFRFGKKTSSQEFFLKVPRSKCFFWNPFLKVKVAARGRKVNVDRKVRVGGRGQRSKVKGQRSIRDPGVGLPFRPDVTSPRSRSTERSKVKVGGQRSRPGRSAKVKVKGQRSKVKGQGSPGSRETPSAPTGSGTNGPGSNPTSDSRPSGRPQSESVCPGSKPSKF